MHAVSHQGKVAFEATTFGCEWSVKLLVKVYCRILWSTISLKRIISFLNFFMELAIKGRSHWRLSLLLVSVQLCAPGQIGLEDFLAINFSGSISLYLCLAIAISSFFFIYFLTSFMKLCRSSFSYDLLIKSRIYFTSQFLRLP